METLHEWDQTSTAPWRKSRRSHLSNRHLMCPLCPHYRYLNTCWEPHTSTQDKSTDRVTNSSIHQDHSRQQKGVSVTVICFCLSCEIILNFFRVHKMIFVFINSVFWKHLILSTFYSLLKITLCIVDSSSSLKPKTHFPLFIQIWCRDNSVNLVHHQSHRQSFLSDLSSLFISTIHSKTIFSSHFWVACWYGNKSKLY